MKGISKFDIEKRLAENLSSYKSLAVAFSGGIDSTLLAFMAKRYVRGRVMLLNVESPFSTYKERCFVAEWAEKQDIELRIARLNPLEDNQIKSNPKERCYHCKKLIMSNLKKIAAEYAIEEVADGTNLDDLNDYRPGTKASDELGIRHPFIDSAISKQDIRELAKENLIENWDAPSSACLASRIPYGVQINEPDLRRIENAEEYLHLLGYMQCRVRLIGNSAKIELPPSILDEILPNRTEIIERFKSFGFKGVFLDLEGYRQGALNEGI